LPLEDNSQAEKHTDAAPCSLVRSSAKRRNTKLRTTRKVSTWFFSIDLTVDECINQREILKSYHPKKEEGR